MTEKFKDSHSWDGQSERRKYIRIIDSIADCKGSCAVQLERYITDEINQLKTSRDATFTELLNNQTKEIESRRDAAFIRLLAQQTKEIESLIDTAYPDGASNHRQAHQKQIDEELAWQATKGKVIDKILAGLVTVLMMGVGFVGNAVWESIKHEAQRVEAKK